jgi:hypothetical protein
MDVCASGPDISVSQDEAARTSEGVVENYVTARSASPSSVMSSVGSTSSGTSSDETGESSESDVSEIAAALRLLTTSDGDHDDSDSVLPSGADESRELAEVVNSGLHDANRRGDFVDIATLIKPTRPTYRDAFEVIKATLLLTNSQCTKILLIWHNLEPVPDYANLPKDGRSLAKPKPEYMQQKKIREVVCGLTKKDFVPFHNPKKRMAMLSRFEQTGSTIPLDSEKYKYRGDIMDFDIEKSFLLESPGLLNPKMQERLLQQVYAARPNLLSPPFLRIVDPQQWHIEQLEPNPARAKMNLFSLKFHADGVQIAKNSVSSECTPLSCAVDRIFSYDPETKKHDVKSGLVVPSSMSPVHTVSVYHGRQACGPMEFGAHWKKELDRLDPDVHDGESDFDFTGQRRLVVSQRVMIADAVERSKRAGMKCLVFSLC